METETEIAVCYEREHAGRHRLDILVEGPVTVELKTVEDLSQARYAEVRSYLKARVSELPFW